MFNVEGWRLEVEGLILNFIAVEVNFKTYFCDQIRCCLLPITLSITILQSTINFC